MEIRKIIVSLLIVVTLTSISLIFLMHTNNKIFQFTDTKIERFQNIELKKFELAIESAKKFSVKFVRSYFAMLDSNVVKNYHNKFILGKTKTLSANVILSSSRESFINFCPSKNSNITFKLTPFPTQLVIASGGQISSSPWSLDKILKVFDNESGALGINYYGYAFIKNFRYGGPIKKIFNISSMRNILILQNLEIEIGNKSEIVFSDTLKYISLLNSDTDFSWAINSAERFAEYLFTTEYADLYIASNYFRVAQKYFSLEKQAREILEIQSRLDKNVDLDYPFEKFNKKILAFEKEAGKLTKDLKFTDRILNYPPFKPKDHYFLWYHPTYESFTWFWISVNLFIYIGLIIYSRH